MALLFALELEAAIFFEQVLFAHRSGKSPFRHCYIYCHGYRHGGLFEFVGFAIFEQNFKQGLAFIFRFWRRAALVARLLRF